MKHAWQRAVLLFTLAIGIATVGCDSEDSNPQTPRNNTGLFKTAGTFSFTSDRGNFSANGIFDTTFATLNAAGAFQYTSGNLRFVIVFAYDLTSQTTQKIVFAGVADTLNAIATGSYPFTVNETPKAAFFGYIPNAADTSSFGAFYILTSGSMNVGSISSTSMSGTFSGNGFNVTDTTSAITVTNGTYNTPIVEHYYELEFEKSSGSSAMQEKIKNFIQEKLRR